MNSLARQAPRRRKIRRKPVTLIAGIICADGIVMASDSQTTWQTGKTWRTDKMTELEWIYGRALVAESGATVTSALVVEELQGLCKDRAAGKSLPAVIELAVRKARERLRAQHFGCSSEELQSIIQRNEMECELMIAHNDPSEGPRLDTISFTTGINRRAKGSFDAVGSGADLAGYLLEDLCTASQDCEIGSVIAVHVVETAKHHDPYCGGPTKLGILRRPSKPAVYVPALKPQSSGMLSPPDYYLPPLLIAQERIDELSNIVAAVESQVKKKRGKMIVDALRKASAKQLKELLKDIEGQEPFWSKNKS